MIRTWETKDRDFSQSMPDTINSLNKKRSEREDESERRGLFKEKQRAAKGKKSVIMGKCFLTWSSKLFPRGPYKKQKSNMSCYDSCKQRREISKKVGG